MAGVTAASSPQSARVGRCALAIASLLVVATLGCASNLLPREQAIQIALRHVGEPSATVLSAREGPFRALGIEDHPADLAGREVWAVVVNGSEPGDCVITPTGEFCPPRPLTTLVVLDAVDGTVLMTEAPSPI
jgi:hypothetical protein